MSAVCPRRHVCCETQRSLSKSPPVRLGSRPLSAQPHLRKMEEQASFRCPPWTVADSEQLQSEAAPDPDLYPDPKLQPAQTPATQHQILRIIHE